MSRYISIISPFWLDLQPQLGVYPVRTNPCLKTPAKDSKGRTLAPDEPSDQ